MRTVVLHAALHEYEWNKHVRDESPMQRLDRNWSDLVQEMRVLQTGVQVLTGFLLILPFQSRFHELSPIQTTVYLVTVACAVGATGCLIAPVSMHRILFRFPARRHHRRCRPAGRRRRRRGRDAAGRECGSPAVRAVVRPAALAAPPCAGREAADAAPATGPGAGGVGVAALGAGAGVLVRPTRVVAVLTGGAPAELVGAVAERCGAGGPAAAQREGRAPGINRPAGRVQHPGGAPDQQGAARTRGNDNGRTLIRDRTSAERLAHAATAGRRAADRRRRPR